MDFYRMDSDEVFHVTNSNMSLGLSDAEVKRRREKFGYNELQENENKSKLILFLSQFNDFMVFVLLGATLISVFLKEIVDAIAIIAIVLVNGILGYFQEARAEKSLEALKELAAPQVTVLREGQYKKIPSKELVPGDVIKFTSGDRIGADVRVFEAASLYIEESALTGESLPVQKRSEALDLDNLGIGDQANMAFMGTLVTRGNGKGIVVSTGMKTAMGQIANLLQNTVAVVTPLQRRLEQLGKILIVVALFLTALVVIIGVYQGNKLYHMFLAGVSLAVAAIPEGLPAIVTVALSLGVQRMIKKKAIVRRLQAVETLGCASFICSDKTGTMTENKMTVTNIWSGGTNYSVTGSGYETDGQFFQGDKNVNLALNKQLFQTLVFGSVCNDAQIIKKKKDMYLDGDPTEGAIIVAGHKAGINQTYIESNFTRVHELPFDSTRKMMSVVVRDKAGNFFVVTKGAPDVLLSRCSTILWHERQEQLNALRVNAVENTIANFANQALRTIAIAYKPIDPKDARREEMLESELTFIGLQGMIDPPRKEVAKAVQECKEAGIKTIMITGDHKLTASSIAKQLGILREDGLVVEGKELDSLSVQQLSDIVDDVNVFARVSPEHKLKIVKALQSNGHIVAMTGDGVNDAPAIKAADIGISMGITGTEVAKEASALILLDDNFATIKSAIKEGRNIYSNIRKFIRYLLASNVGEILVMLFAMILALPLPLVPVQILWVNLVTDGLPAMALGVDSPEDDVMRRSPRTLSEGIFARGLGWKIISRGFLIGIVTLLAFIISYNQHPDHLEYAQTVAFSTLVLAQLIHVFDCRSERSIFHRNPFGNIYLIGAVIVSLLLMLVVIYFPPLQPIFKTLPLEPREWFLIVGLSCVPTFMLAGALFTKKK